MDRPEFYAKLDTFLKALESAQNERTRVQHPILHETAIKEGRRGYSHVGYDDGQRFVKVWEQSGSGKGVKFFIEKDTGIIFGAKSWKIYNPNREYGNLDTTNEWDWSGYGGPEVSKLGKPSLVPKAARR